MDISLVILNYKTSNLLKNCLKSIKETKNNVSYEIIVVDNASHDGCKEMLESNYPDVRGYFLPENIGHAGGNNIGIREARGRYILLLNTDIVFLKDGILDAFVQFMDTHPTVGAVGPQLRNPDGTIQDNCRTFPSIMQPLYSRTFLGKTQKGKAYLNAHVMMSWDHTTLKEVDWMQSSALCVRTSVVKTIGPMDELFFVYFADVDWCKRFWETGHTVYYNPAIQFVHYFHRESAGGIKALLKPVTRIHIKDWFKYILKHNTKMLKGHRCSTHRSEQFSKT